MNRISLFATSAMLSLAALSITALPALAQQANPGNSPDNSPQWTYHHWEGGYSWHHAFHPFLWLLPSSASSRL